MTLLDYGNENFSYRTYWQEPKIPRLTVNNGILSGRGLWEDAALDGVISVDDEEKNRKFLLGNDEHIECRVTMKENLAAPVKKGEQIGRVEFLLNGENVVASYPVTAAENVEERTYMRCAREVFHDYFH